MRSHFINSDSSRQARRFSWYRHRPFATQLIALSIARCTGETIEVPRPCTTPPKRGRLVAGGRGQ